MNPIIITIAETAGGNATLTIQSEENPPSRALVKRIFDVVEPKLREEFKPVRTYFRPVQKARNR